jgi:transcriptional regulator with XRE-family HTH domain
MEKFRSGIVFSQLRKEKGYSLRQACGGYVTKSFLLKYESGETDISLNNFLPLLDQIHVSFATFKSRLEIFEQKEMQGMIDISELVECGEGEKFLELEKSFKEDSILNESRHIALECKVARLKLFNEAFEIDKEVDGFINELTEKEKWTYSDALLLLSVSEYVAKDKIPMILRKIWENKNVLSEVYGNEKISSDMLMLYYQFVLSMIENGDKEEAHFQLEKNLPVFTQMTYRENAIRQSVLAYLDGEDEKYEKYMQFIYQTHDPIYEQLKQLAA